MAKKVVTRGLQVIAGRASNTADAFTEVDSMSVDDSTVAFAAGDTALNTGGAVTTEADADFTGAPTRSSQTVSHVALFGIGVVLTIRRIALHNAAAASVSSSSTTLVAGVDAQSLVKTADYELTLTMQLIYTAA